MILLLDVGNTHTHVGLGSLRRLRRLGDFPTAAWRDQTARGEIAHRLGLKVPTAACFCSVVPEVNEAIRNGLKEVYQLDTLQLTPETVRGVGIDYPKPQSIGQDRLANAVAAFHQFGGPALVVDFGTAVTFDVVNCKGNYVGGIIAPGLSAMTDDLHEKTALLPRIKIREPRRVIGRSTAEAMLSGAVHGYRGLIRGLIAELKLELAVENLSVIATGGYAALIARKLPEIHHVIPGLTLEGLRLTTLAHQLQISECSE